MALFNYATKEITLKIVYYGPGLSGKTTNIQYLHSALQAENKGKLLSLSTESDRTLFFDFLPIELGKIRDFSVRFQLYTVPGQVRYNATRKVVLKGADAVVFVADSQRDMKEQNIESFENMLENLTSNNINPEEISVVLQYNKRDLTNIMSIAELNSDLNKNNALDTIEAEAITGIGVEETFRLITRLVLKDIARKHKIEVPSVPAKEEEKKEEEIFSMQKPEREPLRLVPDDELIEPTAYALEEEAGELVEPEYILEEEMETIPAEEKILSEKGLGLKTAFPFEKEVYTPEPIDIWESKAPPVSMEAIPAEEKTAPEKGPDVPESIDIWGPKARPVSMEAIPAEEKTAPEKGPDLKEAFPFEKEAYKPEAIDTWGPKAPPVPDNTLEIITADIERLNTAISDLKRVLSSLKADIYDIKTDMRNIRDSLQKAREKAGSEEDKNIKEIKREQREIRNIVRDIAVAISDLKEKKSWFRF